jgi:ABC-2 type transport system permease protein
LIVYALNLLGISPTPDRIAMFATMLVSAVIMVYSLWLMMSSLAFWFVRIDNVTELFYAFYEAGRYPVTIYRGFVRGLLTFIVPIAFVTTYPASALLGRLDSATAWMGIIFAIVLLISSNRIWNFAVRYYSSASS